MQRSSKPTTSKRTPKYRRQRKRDGRDVAFVVLSGQRVYLGEYDTPESRAEYHRLLAEWQAGGCCLPVPADELTVVELAADFMRHARSYYRLPSGKSSSEVYSYKVALRPLLDLYGNKPAAEVGPLALKAVRQKWIDAGLSRTHINSQARRIKSVFRWGVENEKVPANVLHALQAVSGLRRGRSDARETEPIRPVAEAMIQAVEPHVSRQVWAMIQLQLLTGMRPGEAVAMRGGDLDASGETWTYTPAHHKTQHHGHSRTVYIGPKAQAVLQPFLKTDLSSPLFQPADAEAERLEAMHANRKTPLGHGNRPGSNRTRKPQRTPGESYTVGSYRRAIDRACDKAFPPPDELARLYVPAKGRKRRSTRKETVAEWRARLGDEKWAELRQWRKDHRWHPNQLRHNAASNLRREYGIDLAQTILGHRLGSTITEIYAEANIEKARQVMAKIG